MKKPTLVLTALLTIFVLSTSVVNADVTKVTYLTETFSLDKNHLDYEDDVLFKISTEGFNRHNIYLEKHRYKFIGDGAYQLFFEKKILILEDANLEIQGEYVANPDVPYIGFSHLIASSGFDGSLTIEAGDRRFYITAKIKSKGLKEFFPHHNLEETILLENNDFSPILKKDFFAIYKPNLVFKGEDFFERVVESRMTVYGNEVRDLVTCQAPFISYFQSNISLTNSSGSRKIYQNTMKRRGKVDIVISSFVKGKCVRLVDENGNVLLETSF